MSDGHWYVASVMSGQERRFARLLAERREGFAEVYVPCVTTNYFVHRTRRWRRLTRVLMAGYVLIRVPPATADHQFDEVVPGVFARLIRYADGRPAPVLPGEFERVVEAEAQAQAAGDPGLFATRFRANDPYRVTQGALAGMTAVCVRTPRPRSSKGLFLVGGRSVTMPLYLFAELS